MDGTLSHILADDLDARLGTASAHVVFDVRRRDPFSTDAHAAIAILLSGWNHPDLGGRLRRGLCFFPLGATA
jgi:hypothetical protein